MRRHVLTTLIVVLLVTGCPAKPRGGGPGRLVTAALPGPTGAALTTPGGNNMAPPAGGGPAGTSPATDAAAAGGQENPNATTRAVAEGEVATRAPLDPRVPVAAGEPDVLGPVAASSGAAGSDATAGTSLDQLIRNFSLVNNPALGDARAGIVLLASDLSKVFPNPRWNGIVSDQGSGVISNNGGNLITDNGAGVISNNGGSYRLLGTQALGDFTLHFDDGTGQIQRLVGPQLEIGMGFEEAAGTKTYTFDLRRSPTGTTGTGRLSVAGAFDPAATPAPGATPGAVLGDGEPPKAVSTTTAEVALVPHGDPRYAMDATVRMDQAIDLAAVSQLAEGPGHWTLRLRAPGMFLTWESRVVVPGSLGPESASVVGHGELLVDTPEGSRDVVIYDTRTEVPREGEAKALVTITHPASGLTMTTAGRAGTSAVARVADSASGAPLGRLDVGPTSIMPLRITLDDGTVKEWEVIPRAWLDAFTSMGLPMGLFPVDLPPVPTPAPTATPTPTP